MTVVADLENELWGREGVKMNELTYNITAMTELFLVRGLNLFSVNFVGPYMVPCLDDKLWRDCFIIMTLRFSEVSS